MEKNKWTFRIVIAIIGILIIPWISNFASNEYYDGGEYTEANLMRVGLYILLIIFLIIRWVYYKFKHRKNLKEI